MRGRNNILLYYHYKVDPKIGKGICKILRIPCACPACVAQHDKYWLPTIAPSYQPSYARVELFYYNKIIEHYKYLIIIKLLDNKTPQFQFDNSYAFNIAVMLTNKA